MLEVNPRFQASTPYLHQEMFRKNKMPLIHFHIADFLSEDIDEGLIPENEDYFFDSFQGGYLFIYSQTEEDKWLKSIPVPGIYELDKNKLHLVEKFKNGQHSLTANQFMIHPGAPALNTRIEHNSQLLKVSFSGSLLRDGKNLNDFTMKAVSLLQGSFV